MLIIIFFERSGYPALIDNKKELACNNGYMRERRSLPQAVGVLGY
jgi:hypothetical protein